MPKKRKNQKGFSLIGVITAVFITSVALVGIMSLVSSSFEGASTAKMKLIASGLAQEGIEVIRDMRKAETEWDDWYSSVTTGDYRIQYDSASLLSSSETPLKYDSNSGLYQYDTGDDSPFYRKVSLTSVSTNEVKVVIEIKWLLPTGDWQYLNTENRLWNWK